MRQTMTKEGVPDALLWNDERSTSTYENALYGAQILRQKGIRRIILVTEAFHMLRSERCFRKQGMDVIPAACDFRLVAWDAANFFPSGHGILENEQVLHEFVGLGWYLIRGRISGLIAEAARHRAGAGTTRSSPPPSLPPAPSPLPDASSKNGRASSARSVPPVRALPWQYL